MRRAVSRGAAAAFALRATGMALAAIATVLLARELGPGGYGTYSWAVAWVATLAVPAALGADQLLTREAALARDRHEWGRLRALLRSTLVWCAGLAVATSALVAVVLAVAGHELATRQSALLVALPILPLAAVASLAQGALLGLGWTVQALAPATAARQAVFLALVAAAVVAGGLSSTGSVALQLAASAIAAVAALALVRRAMPDAPRASLRSTPREWLNRSIPMGAANILLVLDAQVGLLVLGAVGSTAATGVFAVALQCMAPFVLLITAVRLPLAPAIARLGAAGERRRLQAGLRSATRAVVGLSAPIAVLLAAFPEPVLSLFGHGYSGGDTALRLLAIAHLVNAVCAFNGTVLIMSGEERAAMRTAFGCLLLDAALCLALVPPLGARGAAVAVLTSVTARNVLNSAMTRRRLGLDTTALGRLPRWTAEEPPEGGSSM